MWSFSMMMRLAERWLEYLRTMPETGTGYQVVDIKLKDGEEFKQAVVDSRYLTRIHGLDQIPFSESDIADIRVTHDKWDWKNGG
jgi:hypothetical protein